MDDLITSHLEKFNEKTNIPMWNHFNKKDSYKNQPSTSTSSSTSDSRPLHEKLKLLQNEKLDLLPADLLQKYIAYARKNIHPELDKQAREQIKTFYFYLRGIRIGPNCIPITLRQFEGLIRLTEARAKLELSSKATLEHALDVIAIVRYSLIHVFGADTVELQIAQLHKVVLPLLLLLLLVVSSYFFLFFFNGKALKLLTFNELCNAFFCCFHTLKIINIKSSKAFLLKKKKK